jgi:hypothetical protein
MRNYDLTGTPVTALDYFGNTTNQIKHATDRSVQFILNTIDQLTFSLYLDDPMAAVMNRGQNLVGLWRDVNDTVFSKTYTASDPDFMGIVTGTQKNGEENKVHVTVQSPLWRIQNHFHILNHHLWLDTGPGCVICDNAEYDVSALVWKVIDLINNAFGVSSQTGIAKGTITKVGASGAPYFIGKGSPSWAHIMDDLMGRDLHPDLTPRYVHSDGSPTMMDLDVTPVRGTDKSGTVKFNYHKGRAGHPEDWNCDDFQEDGQLVPGQYGNYVWITGQGGPNVSYVSKEDDADIAAKSIYMRLVQLNKPMKYTQMQGMGTRELAAAEHGDKPVYNVVLSPTVPPYFRTDFLVGDVVELNANKGALVVSGLKQRIYSMTLAMSDNNVEVCSVELSYDFFSKVV